MSKSKKTVMGMALGTALLILAGCGNSTAPTQPTQSVTPPTDQTLPVTSPANDDSANLPAPTGKVDDTVNAIIDGANKEGAQVTSDENDAKSATASDTQAVDDISQGL